jgi:hypothetical protein
VRLTVVGALYTLSAGGAGLRVRQLSVLERLLLEACARGLRPGAPADGAGPRKERLATDGMRACGAPIPRVR